MTELVTVARFVVRGKPQPKARPRFDPRTGRAYPAKSTRAYERLVGGAALVATRYEHVGDGFLRRRGEPWPRKELCKREGPRSARKARCTCSWCATEYHVHMTIVLPDRRTRDIDNVAKAVLDGCNGVLWRDDRQVAGLSTERAYDKERPRVEVTVQAVREQPELTLGNTP